MPTFEIPDGPTSVDAPRGSDATAVFSVTNTSSDTADARLSVVQTGGSKAEWFSVDGNRERTFAAGETQTVTVRAKFPSDAPQGDYPFRLRAIAVNDPDNDHAEGPVTIARLGPATPHEDRKPRWWLWILIGVLVILAILAALYFMLRSGGSDTPRPAKAPATAAHGDRLNNGQSLKGAASQEIVSKSGFFRAVMQNDCNFVVYNPPRALWASGTNGRGAACNVVMQLDGNLVVYTEAGQPVWASNTSGNPGAEVVMQDDGNLVIYAAGRALWASNTVVR